MPTSCKGGGVGNGKFATAASAGKGAAGAGGVMGTGTLTAGAGNGGLGGNANADNVRIGRPTALGCAVTAGAETGARTGRATTAGKAVGAMAGPPGFPTATNEVVEDTFGADGGAAVLDAKDFIAASKEVKVMAIGARNFDSAGGVLHACNTGGRTRGSFDAHWLAIRIFSRIMRLRRTFLA